jgi:hypothetical protein
MSISNPRPAYALDTPGYRQVTSKTILSDVIETGEPVQDGLLQYYLSQPSDWKVQKRLDTEYYNFLDQLPPATD